MGKGGKYLEVLQLEQKQAEAQKMAQQKYSLAKKINKASNIQLFDMIHESKEIRDTVSGTMYRSNPSYEGWSSVCSFYYERVNNRDKVLNYLKELLTISDNFLGDKDNFRTLKILVEYEDSFVRPINSWSPKSRNAVEQLHSLIRHLFAKYPVPEFLEKCFIKNEIEGIFLYITIGAGKSLKSYDGYPTGMLFPNKAAQHLYTTPSNLELFPALRRAQILYMGGDDYIFNALMRSNVLRERIPVVRVNGVVSTLKEEFWLTVIKFFIDNKMIAPNKIAEIIDYINKTKFEDQFVVGDNGVRQRVPAPQPNFSMKNRNPQTLIDLSDEWHEQIARQNRINQRIAGINRYSKVQKNFTWNGMRINNGTFSRAKKTKYKVIQLLSYYDLRDEGNAMRHCVASYANYCMNGKSAIFSVQEYIEDQFVERVATIEIKENNVVQVRGRYNRKPSDTVINVIKEWANHEFLGISTYAI
jgi:hypothetical protein